MVSVYFGALTISLLASFVVAPTAKADTLTARVDRSDVVLGEAIALELTAVSPGASRPLDASAFDALAADFEVFDVSRGGTPARQTLSATLYPRRSGHLRVPVLRAVNAASAAIDITVRESGPGLGRVLFRVGVEPDAPHVRASAMLYLDIYYSGTLLWSAPEPLPAPGVHLRALAGSQRTATVDGEHYDVQRHAWAATALRDGPIDVVFAPLRATKFGQRLRYSVPKFSYVAQPVPAYLPVYVPVGMPEVRLESLPQQLIVGRPVNWQFTLSGGGISANGAAQLLAATLGEGRDVRLYAPVIESIDEAQPRTPQRTLRVTIPVQALQHGDVELPQLTLPYFDPGSARLDALVVSGARIAAISPVRQTALRIAAMALGALFAAVLLRRTVAVWQRRRRKRELLERLARAQDARELKALLLDCAARAESRPCLTLRRWLRRIDTAHAAADLPSFIARLERACYANGAGAPALADLKRDARSLVRTRAICFAGAGNWVT